MAHDAESYNFPHGEALYKRISWTGSVTTIRQASGLQRVGARSKTLHNPRDAEGWRRPSPYSAEKTEYNLGFYELKAHRVDRGNPSHVQDYLFQTYMATGLNLGDSDYLNSAETIQRALLKIGASKSNLWVTVAERQKTVDLVTGAFRDLTTFFEGLATPRGRRRLLGQALKPGASRRAGKKFTDSYLAYRYGVVPTMLDLQGIASAAEEAAFGHRNAHLSGRASKKQAVNSQLPGKWAAGDGITHDVVTKGMGERGVSVRIDAICYFPPFRTFQELGLTNLPNAAWELIPYSFVVDWVLGVGEWLQGYTALDGLEDVTVTTTYWSKVTTTREIPVRVWTKSTSDGWDTTYNVSLISPSYQNFHFKRVISGSPSSKLFWKNPISLTHFADAFALLIGAIGIAEKRKN